MYQNMINFKLHNWIHHQLSKNTQFTLTRVLMWPTAALLFYHGHIVACIVAIAAYMLISKINTYTKIYVCYELVREIEEAFLENPRQSREVQHIMLKNMSAYKHTLILFNAKKELKTHELFEECVLDAVFGKNRITLN